ncbi:MAG: cation:dicarboxylase symporter family transporter [Gemmatimonadaceae bacterium]
MPRPNRLLVALLAGLVVGIAISLAGGSAARVAIAIVEPVGAIWVNAIRMTVVPLVVSLLITGVVSTAGASAVGRVGVRALVAFIALVALSALFAVIVVPPLFAWLSVAPESAASLRATASSSAAATAQAVEALPGFAQWVTSLIPTNPVRAAADGAMLPLVVFTLAFSLALLRLGAERRDAVVAFFDGVSQAMLVLVRWVIAVAPIGIFALIIPPAARLGVMIAGAVGYYILAMAVAYAGFIALLYPVVMAAARVSISTFARAAFPAQTVAFSSSSSLASLPALITAAEDGLGIQPAVSRFVLPLAVSTFKIATPITWTVGAMFIATLYGIHLHATQVITIALAGFALGFSIPGVPNAAFLVIAPLFVNIGLPPEGVALLIAADAIPDLMGTMTNVTGDLAAAAIVSRTTKNETPKDETVG